MTDEEMIQLAIDTIRTLSIDAVQQAKSGNPGAPMALAPPDLYDLESRHAFRTGPGGHGRKGVAQQKSE
jgi:hypothetical protein